MTSEMSAPRLTPEMSSIRQPSDGNKLGSRADPPLPSARVSAGMWMTGSGFCGVDGSLSAVCEASELP
jgi:hypothetical protein